MVVARWWCRSRVGAVAVGVGRWWWRGRGAVSWHAGLGRGGDRRCGEKSTSGAVGAAAEGASVPAWPAATPASAWPGASPVTERPPPTHRSAWSQSPPPCAPRDRGTAAEGRRPRLGRPQRPPPRGPTPPAGHRAPSADAPLRLVAEPSATRPAGPSNGSGGGAGPRSAGRNPRLPAARRLPPATEHPPPTHRSAWSQSPPPRAPPPGTEPLRPSTPPPGHRASATHPSPGVTRANAPQASGLPIPSPGPRPPRRPAGP